MQRGLRERKREATRRSMTHAAMRLFDERGYDNVTVEEIAEACDVSPRTFFRYFGTKEEVLFAESEERRQLLLDALAEQPQDATPFQAVYGACRAVADHYVADRELLRLRARIIDRATSLQPRDAELPRRWDRDVMEELRASGRAVGMSEVDLRLDVGASMTAFRVAIETWIRRDDDDLHGLIDIAFGRLVRGLGR